MSDPRSINQSLYTAVGCGATRTFELDNNGIVGQHPDGYDLAAEICVIEANETGSVRIRGYDLNSDTYFCDYFIEDVNDRSTFAYTYLNMSAHDAAPVFDENTKAYAFRNENGEWVLSFDEAKAAEGYIVHEYKVTIKDENGKKIFSKNFINDYYVFDDDDTATLAIGAGVFAILSIKQLCQLTHPAVIHPNGNLVQLELPMLVPVQSGDHVLELLKFLLVNLIQITVLIWQIIFARRWWQRSLSKPFDMTRCWPIKRIHHSHGGSVGP